MLTDEQGAQAIIALQAVGGVVEPEERAAAAWESMSDTEKTITEDTHRMFCGGFE